MEFRARYVATWVTVLAVGVIVSANNGALLAQSGRYSSDWQNPDGAQTRSRPVTQPQRGSAQVQELVDELDNLINAASKAQAADPKFLRDLRNLARRFDWPWRKQVFFDDFSDGNVSANPAWAVGGAPVTVDAANGLRMRVSRPGESTSQSQGSSQSEDTAAQILGQILNQRSGDRQRRPRQFRESVLAISARTANQFALEADIVFANADGGRIQLGVVQGSDGLGYRVTIKPDGRNADVEILRVGANGSSIIEAIRVKGEVWLARKMSKPKKVLFTRDKRGRMSLSIDKNVVLNTRDRAFSDGFDGFIVRNSGGDFTVRSIAGFSS